MKSFDIPAFYRSSFVSRVKELRKNNDPRKKDFNPTLLNFGPVQFLLPRHFGFCYGVENAIEISYKAIEENPEKRIFLLSQMIHNPDVNADLESKGIKFLMDTYGKQLIAFDELHSDDIVIIPAFGTTPQIEDILTAKGIEIQRYNTTCPFVERVWKKSEKLGEDQYTVIIHGKHKHEETRATFSRSASHSHALVVKDLHEAKVVGNYILGTANRTEFDALFAERCSYTFDPDKDLQRIGVINQTTMLATETQEIADYFKQIMLQKYGESELNKHFADTRDTLCYATNENQQSTYGLLQQEADLALVVGGYNSSNTSHLVELLETKLPTYYIKGASEIQNAQSISHFDYHKQLMVKTENFLPKKDSLRIIITSGASCPDTVVEAVMEKIVSFFENTVSPEIVLDELSA